VRLAQAIPPEEERDFEDGNPASEAEFEAIDIERQELIQRVREIDPTWSPRQSATRRDSIESDIVKARGERDEAEARLRELGRASAEDLITAFRQRDRDLLSSEGAHRDRRRVAKEHRVDRKQGPDAKHFP
jgi:hypothetical protein